MFFIGTLILFFILELLYFKVAMHLNITDTPNSRSSHAHKTITGAGIIFPVAFFLPLIITHEFVHFRSLMTGLLLISCVSFIDDVKELDRKSRIFIHLIAVSLVLWQTGGLFRMQLWQIIPAFILVAGIINACNFMDGINGITAFYSLVTVTTIFYQSKHGFRLPVPELFLSLIAAIIVFSFFNVRKKAVCFCGDVGSISIAFILSFLIIEIMIQDDSAKWVLLLGVYGLDSVGTIVLRAIRHENILEPHRTHFFQHLVNGQHLPHVLVSVIYAAVQLALNVVLITQPTWVAVLSFLLLVIIYAGLRLRLEGRHKLFNHYNESKATI